MYKSNEIYYQIKFIIIFANILEFVGIVKAN